MPRKDEEKERKKGALAAWSRAAGQPGGPLAMGGSGGSGGGGLLSFIGLGGGGASGGLAALGVKAALVGLLGVLGVGAYQVGMMLGPAAHGAPPRPHVGDLRSAKPNYGNVSGLPTEARGQGSMQVVPMSVDNRTAAQRAADAAAQQAAQQQNEQAQASGAPAAPAAPDAAALAAAAAAQAKAQAGGAGSGALGGSSPFGSRFGQLSANFDGAGGTSGALLPRQQGLFGGVGQHFAAKLGAPQPFAKKRSVQVAR
ncbi:MAG: hypothetical protein KGK30_08240, partial [Elusimicrobia bacterium]|nr:hypothetical protein [Elusimicrobiota bacterium]